MAALRSPADQLHEQGRSDEATQSYLSFLPEQPSAFAGARLKALVRVADYALQRGELNNTRQYLHDARQLLSSDQELLEKKVVFEKLEEQTWEVLEPKELVPVEEHGVSLAGPKGTKRKRTGRTGKSRKKRKGKSAAWRRYRPVHHICFTTGTIVGPMTSYVCCTRPCCNRYKARWASGCRRER